MSMEEAEQWAAELTKQVEQSPTEPLKVAAPKYAARPENENDACKRAKPGEEIQHKAFQ